MSRDFESISALPWLWGTRAQRIDGPRPGCFSLTLFDAGQKHFLVLMLSATTRGVGSVSERPKGEAASPFVQRMRRLLEGARLNAATWLAQDAHSSHAHALLLSFTRGEQPVARIVADFDPRSPNLLLLRDDDTIAGAADERARRERFPTRESRYTPTRGKGIACVLSPEALSAAGQALVETGKERSEDGVRSRMKAQTRAALKRLKRKIEAIRGDLARAQSAPQLRREAQVLLCHLASVPKGVSSVRLLDESSEPPTWLDIALDPARSAQQAAQQRFERARKLERGVAIASSRLAEAEAEAARLQDLSARLETEPLEALTGLGETADLELPSRPAKRPKQQERVSYRVFFSLDQQKILVGKGAADNDTLTLTVARPHDHWLHVRGVPGAHIVVPLDRKATISQELLLDAAHLAAHFSKQRGEPTVEIAHTERRFVRKPRGASPGSVNVDRERVFILRIERDRLARLLASER